MSRYRLLGQRQSLLPFWWCGGRDHEETVVILQNKYGDDPRIRLGVFPVLLRQMGIPRYFTRIISSLSIVRSSGLRLLQGKSNYFEVNLGIRSELVISVWFYARGRRSKSIFSPLIDEMAGFPAKRGNRRAIVFIGWHLKFLAMGHLPPWTAAYLWGEVERNAENVMEHFLFELTSLNQNRTLLSSVRMAEKWGERLADSEALCIL